MKRDHELLAEYCATRDSEAFAELTRRYAGIVYAACLRVTGNRADAEDAAQETLLQLARTPDAIISNVGGWLYRTAQNKAREQMRSAARRRAHETNALPQTAADPDVQEVDEVVESLGDDLREPVILHFIRGLSQQEVAAELQLSQPTVSRRIERALELLRSRLAPARATGILGSVAFAGEPAIAAQIGQQIATVVASVKTAATGSGATVTGLSAGKLAIAAVVVATAAVGITAAMGVGEKRPAVASTVPAAAIVAAQTNAAASPAAYKIEGTKVTIDGVGSVDLLGICSDETDPPTWWGPDGGPIAMPFTRSSVQGASGWTGATGRRFVAQLTGRAMAMPYFWDFEGSQGSRWTGNPPMAQFLPRPDLKEAEAAFGGAARTATVRFKLATAKPQTLLESDGKAGKPGEDVRIVNLRPAGQGTVLNYSVANAADVQGVMISFVVDESGHWTAHNNSNRNPGDKRVEYEQQFDVPLDRVVKIIVQRQPYTHWITWANVPLTSDAAKVATSVRTTAP